VEINRSIELFKALADLSRLRILRTLAEGEQYGEEIAKRLSLAVSTVSFHLKKLAKAGLVIAKREQYYTVYQLNSAAMRTSLQDLLAGESGDEEIQAKRMAHFRSAVLNTFMPDGRLHKIPVQKKKRLIVLQSLLQEFHPERSYSEEEINRRLGIYSDDYCTLRRLLIDEGLMSRRDGNYWLVDGQPQPPEQKESKESSASDYAAQAGKDTEMTDRSALKRSYKEMKIPMGIYCVRNRQNGKVLIGSYPNLNAILNRVRAQLRFNSFPNAELQADFNRLGEDQFDFEILDKIEVIDGDRSRAEEELKLLEELWLNKLSPYGEKGYNRPPKTKD